MFMDHAIIIARGVHKLQFDQQKNALVNLMSMTQPIYEIITKDLGHFPYQSANSKGVF